MNTKIVVGNLVVKDFGKLRLVPVDRNTFTFQLPLSPVSADPQKIAGKSISIWTTGDNGKRQFLTGTVAQTELLQTQLSNELTIHGTVKTQLYWLSLLKNYRIPLALAVLIPLSFLAYLAYIYIRQANNLTVQTGTIESFTKRSGGARSPVVYKFKTKEHKASFERSYEGLSRLIAHDIRDKIYQRPSNAYSASNTYLFSRELKPASARKYQWYIDDTEKQNLSRAQTISYINLTAVNQTHSKLLFYYDLYAFVCFRADLLALHFLSFIATLGCLATGLSLKTERNVFWKVYAVGITLIFVLLFIL